jgi:hypothetical protein
MATATQGTREMTAALEAALAVDPGAHADEWRRLARVAAAADGGYHAPEVMQLASRAHEDRALAIDIYLSLLAHAPATADVRDGEARDHWLRSANNALVALQLDGRAAEAAALADRVTGFVAENPYLCHSGACSLAGVGRLDEAMALVVRAVELDYEHLEQLRADEDLAMLREHADWQALFAAEAALPRVPRWATGWSAGEYARFVEILRAELRQRGLLAEYGALEEHGAVHVGSMHIGLAGLYRTCNAEPLAVWPEVVRQHFGALVDAAPDDREALRAALKLRLYAEEVAGPEAGRRIHYQRPFAPGLVLALTLDLPERVESVGELTGQKLGLDEDAMFALARAHLDEEPRLEEIELELEGAAAGLRVFEGDSFYAATHLARLREYVDVPPGRAVIVAAPSRHKVIVAAVTRDHARVLGQVVQLSWLAFESDPGKLTPHPYLWDGTSFWRIPSGVRDDGQVWVAPPPELLAAIERAEHAPQA